MGGCYLTKVRQLQAPAAHQVSVQDSELVACRMFRRDQFDNFPTNLFNPDHPIRMQFRCRSVQQNYCGVD